MGLLEIQPSQVCVRGDVSDYHSGLSLQPRPQSTSAGGGEEETMIKQMVKSKESVTKIPRKHTEHD